MTDTRAAFEGQAGLYAELLGGIKHLLNNALPGKVSIVDSGCCGAVFVFGQQAFQLIRHGLPFRLNGLTLDREYVVGQFAGTPAHIPDQYCLFIRSGLPVFSLQLLQDFDSGQIILSFLFPAALYSEASVCDPVVF